MSATRKQHCTTQTAAQPTAVRRAVLYLAFELGWGDWKLAFGTEPSDNLRLRTIGGRNTQTLLQEIAKAKKRFGLPEDALVVSCYEAGRDGFWLHRFLERQGVSNCVVDSSSIEVKRRGRRRKTDDLDAGKLLSMLMRWHQGEHKVWSVVQVPSVADEDRRQLHRDLLELKAERTQRTNRIKGLLAKNKGDIVYCSCVIPLLHWGDFRLRIALMPRTARSTPAGFAYHVLNRGNHRAPIFHSEDDYDAFVHLLAQAVARFPVRMLGFCLMPNHMHLALWPQTDDGVSALMHWLLTTHATRYLKQHRVTGHVWQGRFRAFPTRARLPGASNRGDRLADRKLLPELRGR